MQSAPARPAPVYYPPAQGSAVPAPEIATDRQPVAHRPQPEEAPRRLPYQPDLFTASEMRTRMAEMVGIAERVDPVVCSTGLEAEVRELRLIAEHSPRYNRRRLNANSSLYVYFYLNASAEQLTPETHTISVRDGGPTAAAVASSTISMTASERGATANNKITVVTHTPSGPGIPGPG